MLDFSLQDSEKLSWCAQIPVSVVTQMDAGIKHRGVSAVSKSIAQECTTQSICSTKGLAFNFKFRHTLFRLQSKSCVLPPVGNVSETCKNERIDNL